MEHNSKRAAAARVLAALGKALCYLILFLGCQLLVSIVYSLAAALYIGLDQGSADPELFSRELVRLIYACTNQISLISNLAVLVVLAAFFLLRHKNPLREAGFLSTPGRHVFTAAAITPALYVAVTLILALLPEAWLDSYAEASASLNQTGLIPALATVAAAPVVEEIIFRGLILSRLKQAMPGWLAAVLSALVFGLCHGQPVWMAYAFALGLVFGFMDLRARSVWPSLAAHIMFNGIGYLAVWLEELNASSGLFLPCLSGVSAVMCAVVLAFRAAHPLRGKSSGDLS